MPGPFTTNDGFVNVEVLVPKVQYDTEVAVDVLITLIVCGKDPPEVVAVNAALEFGITTILCDVADEHPVLNVDDTL